jgi:hypothetical protein
MYASEDDVRLFAEAVTKKRNYEELVARRAEAELRDASIEAMRRLRRRAVDKRKRRNRRRK